MSSSQSRLPWDCKWRLKPMHCQNLPCSKNCVPPISMLPKKYTFAKYTCWTFPSTEAASCRAGNTRRSVTWPGLQLLAAVRRIMKVPLARSTSARQTSQTCVFAAEAAGGWALLRRCAADALRGVDSNRLHKAKRTDLESFSGTTGSSFGVTKWYVIALDAAPSPASAALPKK